MQPRNTVCLRACRRIVFPAVALITMFMAAETFAAMLYKDYVVRYDRGWDILCDPYQVQQGDWVLKIFRQKGEIAHDDFREFLGIFERLNPHVKDIDRIRPGQVVDIPLKKLVQGNLPGQSSGVVTIPFVMINTPEKVIKKHIRSYTIQRGDTVSSLIARQFGGRYGNTTYNRGLALFRAANPHIKDLDRIYAGQKIYMPDPSIREQSWYADLFDKDGNLVEKMATPDDANTAAAAAPPPAPQAPAAAPPLAPEPGTTGPAADAAAVVGGRLLAKGTYFLPMKQGKDFELDLSRHPLIDLQNGSKVVLTTTDRVMNVDLPLVQSYWDDVKVARIPENASAEQIVAAVLNALGETGQSEDQLAFDDGGVTVSVTAKWIRSEPTGGGAVRHICITPITAPGQMTHDAIRRYLDQNDISIKEILTSGQDAARPSVSPNRPAAMESIDGSSQKALVASFARRMGFQYSPNTTISFPYAGIQVQAQSNLLSFGNGREILIDFGDLYGDAIKAISETGLSVLQLNAGAGPIDTIQQLTAAAGLSHTRSPVFYGADRPAAYNTAISVNGILLPTDRGENLLFTDAPVPALIALFISDQDIRMIDISDTAAN